MKRLIGIIVLVALIIGGAVWYGISRNDNNSDENQPNLSVSAFNETQNTEATQVPAVPQDSISFSLKAENPTDETIEGYVIQADISNIANSSTLIDAGGASYNSANNSLVWTPLDIAPHQSIDSKFVVRVNDLPDGVSSADLTLKFNNEVRVSVLSQATVSGTATPNPSKPYTAPSTGTSGWVTLALAAIATIGAFWYRQKQKTA